MNRAIDIRDTSHIQKFNGEGFQLWRFQMEILFEAKKLLEVVNGIEVKVEEARAIEIQWL